MRTVILGGIGFIGPREVRYVLIRGHRVTTFNRGKMRPNVFTQLTPLHNAVEK
jgi:2'-hydroxyisoflavone reductase